MTKMTLFTFFLFILRILFFLAIICLIVYLLLTWTLLAKHYLLRKKVLAAKKKILTIKKKILTIKKKILTDENKNSTNNSWKRRDLKKEITNLEWEISYLFSTELPVVHKFTYTPLHSAGLPIDPKKLELLKERQECANDLKQAKDELDFIRRAVELDKVLPDKSQNHEMKKIISHYESFFDEESGNNRSEGIQQLYKELLDDFNAKKHRYEKTKQELDTLNRQSIFVLLPINTSLFAYIRCILPIFSVILSLLYILVSLFIFVDLNLSIYIPDFVFEIINYILYRLNYVNILWFPSLVLVWSCYDVWRQTKKCISIFTRIKEFFVKKNNLNTLVYLFIMAFMLIILSIPEESSSFANILALLVF